MKNKFIDGDKDVAGEGGRGEASVGLQPLDRHPRIFAPSAPGTHGLDPSLPTMQMGFGESSVRGPRGGAHSHLPLRPTGSKPHICSHWKLPERGWGRDVLRGTIGARPHDLQVCKATEQRRSEWSERHDQEQGEIQVREGVPHKMRKKTHQSDRFLCPSTKQH